MGVGVPAALPGKPPAWQAAKSRLASRITVRGIRLFFCMADLFLNVLSSIKIYSYARISRTVRRMALRAGMALAVIAITSTSTSQMINPSSEKT